jgi:hypothetical protein
MRFLMPSALAGLILIAPTLAAADCAGEIAAMFEGGAWDPFTRENRRETTIVHHPGGKTAPSSDVKWDGPYKSINCTPHGCFMAIGNASWTGPSFDGPWSRSGDTNTVDPEVFVKGTRDRFKASITEAECLGPTPLDGVDAVKYRFFSKPAPNEHGSWWGGRYSVWVTPDGKRIPRMEISEGIASWAPTPSKDVLVTTITYDPSIRIDEPK